MFSDPSFWVAVAFVIFIVAIFKPVSRMATGSLDQRADDIRADIEEAERLREEAQELLATYERKQRQAAKDAEEITDHARKEAERMAEHAAETLSNVLARREKMAMERIAQAEAAAVEEVRNAAVDIAVEAATRVLAGTLSANKADAMIDAAIKDLPGKLN
ncbi:MAG: F0F1 ATP synthase subunit B [Rhodospirillales bacterium]|nr:F0F1 ATP synthase subunit B [Rhodospirillales bacterium]